MVMGFFAGTTVNSLIRKAEKIKTLKAQLSVGKDQAIADRMASIKAAQDDIDAIRKL